MSLVEALFSTVQAVQEHLCHQVYHTRSWRKTGRVLGVWFDGSLCSFCSFLFIYDLEVIEIMFQRLVNTLFLIIFYFY